MRPLYLLPVVALPVGLALGAGIAWLLGKLER